MFGHRRRRCGCRSALAQMAVAAIMQVFCLAPAGAQERAQQPQHRAELEKQEDIFRSQGDKVPGGYIVTRGLAIVEVMAVAKLPVEVEVCQVGRWRGTRIGFLMELHGHDTGPDGHRLDDRAADGCVGQRIAGGVLDAASIPTLRCRAARSVFTSVSQHGSWSVRTSPALANTAAGGALRFGFGWFGPSSVVGLGTPPPSGVPGTFPPRGGLRQVAQRRSLSPGAK